jgi:phosphatidylserine/phosphatidylglycerophosphate/cardiolipin synthase-like enzyme
MENQYFTSPLVAAALSKRLAEPEGPEVVLVTTEHSASWFDQMTMDRTRAKFIARLQDADRHGRFRIYAPVTGLGRTIIVHAKLAIIDDVLLRVGSANMNNRSTGFDSECDVTFEAGGESGEANRAVIGALRTRLVAHWLGCEDGVVEAAQDRAGALGAAIEALRAEGLVRLRPLVRQPMGPLADLIAAYHLGDPVAPGDSWRPWKRKRQIDLDIKRALP